MLALVILSRESCSRTKLAELLWPQAPEDSRRANLRSLLPKLRSALGESLMVSEHQIAVEAGAVAVDAWQLDDEQEYSGDFMPGFEQDWVIDERLRLRQVAYESAVLKTRQSMADAQFESALGMAQRAIEIDALQDEAVGLRVRCLEMLGQRERAISTVDDHRRRVLSSLGSLPQVGHASEAKEGHPLLDAAEWMLTFNPQRLPSFLAATHNEWLSLPVQPALDVHDRALALMPASDNAEMQFVQAMRIVLLVQAGRLGANRSDAEAALLRSIEAGEFLTAARLAGALSYGYLSLGDFARSKGYAERAVAYASQVSDPVFRYEIEYLHTIIVGHAGDGSEYRGRMKTWIDEIDNAPSEMLRAGVQISSVEVLVQSGQIDKASRYVERARRVFSSAGSARNLAWAHMSESMICDAIGDRAGAREALLRVLDIGTATAGHSAISMAEDRLAQVYCAMGEFDLSAEAYGRSALLRKKLGTVPSVAERPIVEQTRARLRAKMGDHKLQQIFRRVQTVAAS